MNELKFVRSLNLSFNPQTNYRIIKSLPCKKYQGCARITIVINDRWVLKVAKNDEGIRQNKNEINIWNEATKNERNFLCRVRDYCQNNLWLIQERIIKKKRRHYEKTRELMKNFYLDRLIDSYSDCNQIGYTINNKLKIYDYGLT